MPDDASSDAEFERLMSRIRALMRMMSRPPEHAARVILRALLEAYEDSADFFESHVAEKPYYAEMATSVRKMTSDVLAALDGVESDAPPPSSSLRTPDRLH